MAKLKLAVLFGGRACEHDVSVVTALQCMEAVDTEQYDLIPVYIARDGAWYTGEPLRKLDFVRRFRPEADGVLRVYPDVTSGSGALLAIERRKGLFRGGDSLVVAARMDVALLAFHGMNGEDGSVQGLLELMNVPYTSSGLVGSAVGMDKIAMRGLFRGCGFPVLESAWLSRDEWERDNEAILTRMESSLTYPMFVKPANLGSSIGISRAQDRASLREAIEVALSYDRRVMVERAVEQPVEVNCSVLGFGEDVTASVLEMPVSWEEFLTFDEKYLRGAKGQGSKAAGMESLQRKIPAPISEALTTRVQAMAVDIFRILDCKGVVRIDFMLDGDTLYVGEINTIPGSLAFYLWTASGMPYPRLIGRMVELAFRAHAEKNRSVFAYDSGLLGQATLGAKGAKQ
ncbi:D-alanine--D-alanine ligase [Eubacteriales bacterium OttesenSCG-928-A19]|nr:D-alanine--D-alanine ligase [Eubacteriales bacterium OttesenSCG-928-A19]